MDVERTVRTHISSNDSIDEVPFDLLQGKYSGYKVSALTADVCSP